LKESGGGITTVDLNEMYLKELRLKISVEKNRENNMRKSRYE